MASRFIFCLTIKQRRETKVSHGGDWINVPWSSLQYWWAERRRGWEVIIVKIVLTSTDHSTIINYWQLHYHHLHHQHHSWLRLIHTRPLKPHIWSTLVMIPFSPKIMVTFFVFELTRMDSPAYNLVICCLVDTRFRVRWRKEFKKNFNSRSTFCQSYYHEVLAI